MSSLTAASSAALLSSAAAGLSAPVEVLPRLARFRLLMTPQLNPPQDPQPPLSDQPRSTHDLEHRVDRTMPSADLQRVLDRPCDELLGLVHGGQRVGALGGGGGGLRREDPAASVSVRFADSRRLELDELSAVVVVVDGEPV